MATPRDAIVALVHVYAERIDAGDLDGVARLFTEATYGAEGGPVRDAGEAVLAALRAAVVLHDGLPRTKHVITNVTVEVDAAAGTATARSYFTVLQATSTLPLKPILAGRYRIHIDLVGDVSQHLRRS